jgi:ketosteroid isomerase-like protein
LIARKETVMSAEQNVEAVLAGFRAIERRDAEGFRAVCHPEAEFHWPPSLGGGRGGRSFYDIWDPLQPTESERRMDPRVVAASDEEVVVLWRQRGLSPGGERFDGEVLGLYQVPEGKYARGQMFYFDTVALLRFLEAAESVAI